MRLLAVIVGASLALLLLFSACGGGDDSDSDEPTPTSTQPEVASSVTPGPTNAPTPAPTPTATEAPPPQTELSVGDTGETPAGNTLTIYSYETPVTAEFFDPDPGNVFAAIDVEGCTRADLEGTASLNPYDFQLQMPDNTRRDPDIGIREPALNDTTLLPGDCVRGFVTFQVPADVTPAFVVFETFDEDFNPVVIKWSFQ